MLVGVLVDEMLVHELRCLEQLRVGERQFRTIVTSRIVYDCYNNLCCRAIRAPSVENESDRAVPPIRQKGQRAFKLL